jgi:hypothetical protein
MHVSAWVIFFAVSYQTGSILQYLTAQLTPPIIGLVNMFIHLRVGLGWSHAQEPDRSMVAMTSSASIFRETIPAADSYDLEIIRAPHEADDVYCRYLYVGNRQTYRDIQNGFGQRNRTLSDRDCCQFGQPPPNRPKSEMGAKWQATIVRKPL